MSVAAKVLVKSAISVVAWVILVLVVAAVVEIAYGRNLPALTNLITLVLLAPVLFMVWRR